MSEFKKMKDDILESVKRKVSVNFMGYLFVDAYIESRRETLFKIYHKINTNLENELKE